MYGNNSFDPNAAFAGGGYMPSQATQTTENAIAPSRNREAQALLPVTVKQITQAVQANNDDKTEFQVDGVGLRNVRLVGMLFEKTGRITDISFVLDDGTGRFPCTKWINEAANDENELEPLRDGTYVMVHGQLRGFQGKKQLHVFSVRPITDYNEITNHFVECIYVHCYNTKLRKQQSAGQIPGHASTSAINTPSKGYQGYQSAPNHVSVQYNMSGVQGLDKLVLDYLQRAPGNASERGVHRNDIAQYLKPQAPEDLVIEAIESLVSEGMVYSTTDDFHYKTTTNG